MPKWASIDNEGAIVGTPTDNDASAGVVIAVAAKNNKKQIIAESQLIVRHGAAFFDTADVDYYDLPFNGAARQYRNDLIGELEGEVQFVQSHAVAPLHEQNVAQDSGDETNSVYRSDVVAKREALVLFFPSHVSDVITLDVKVLVDGEPQTTLSLHHPNTLPKADNPTALGIEYSAKAWWVKLPYDLVTNGLSLEFIANQAAANPVSGLLSQVDVSPVNRMVVTSIRVGMLAEPQHSANHATLIDPIGAATDYFQTLPVSELIFASYADLHLPRVMRSNGVIYDQDSEDDAHNSGQNEGDAYGGDMRENIGKAQISTGINMANIGITSWRMNQNYPQPFKQTTAHHACGLYTNGVQCHGLSGGNGIATLYSSTGNEFSHELGHGFSAYTFTPDYYGNDKAAPVSDFIASTGHWGTHNPTSGYGYIMQRQKLRASIAPGLDSDGKPWFKNNAMSSGDPQSPLSNYTYYTGFMALNIQRDLNKYVMPTPKSEFASGYKVWNSNAGQWQAASPTCDGAPCPSATEVGVPVTTLLGAYQPPKRSDKPSEYVQYDNWTKNTDTDKAVIYPALHGNYGNLFDLPAPNFGNGQDHCWLAVSNNQETKNIELSATRALNSEAANQFWHYDTESYPDNPQLKASNGQCVDIHSGFAPNPVGLYGCGANKANQSWYDIAQNQALWFALADANALIAIFETLE